MNGPSARSSRRFARLLHLLPPELAHAAALRLLKLAPPAGLRAPPSLATRLAGLPLPHPIGLAAGFDKNAEAVAALSRLGFSLVEIGTVTPRPQGGNPRPRLFRLPADGALINRLGFNNEGAERVAARLARRRAGAVVGANLGINRDAAEPVADYLALLRRLYPLADYFTINVSSPNTPGLRALQRADALHALLSTVLAERDGLRAESGQRKPVLLKIAPDLDEAGEAGIAEVAGSLAIDGLIVGNTTIERVPTLTSRHAGEAGGLSGSPLFPRSTRLLARMSLRLHGALPLVGVGGVASAAHAYAKIRAGASVVQLYTAFVYEGPGLVRRMVRELALLLERDGIERLEQACGLDAERLGGARLDRRQHVS
jgi:dihydroorotate dehydrogenase